VFSLFCFFRYFETISAVNPVVVAAPAVASAMAARQTGHMVQAAPFQSTGAARVLPMADRNE
jgi:hypothetical protein